MKLYIFLLIRLLLLVSFIANSRRNVQAVPIFDLLESLVGASGHSSGIRFSESFGQERINPVQRSSQVRVHNEFQPHQSSSIIHYPPQHETHQWLASLLRRGTF